MKHFIGYIKDNPVWIGATTFALAFAVLFVVVGAPAMMWIILGAVFVLMISGTFTDVHKRKKRHKPIQPIPASKHDFMPNAEHYRAGYDPYPTGATGVIQSNLQRPAITFEMCQKAIKVLCPGWVLEEEIKPPGEDDCRLHWVLYWPPKGRDMGIWCSRNIDSISLNSGRWESLMQTLEMYYIQSRKIIIHGKKNEN